VTPQALRLDGIAAPLIVRRNARARRVSIRMDVAGDAVIIVLPQRARLEDGIALARANAGWVAAQLQTLPPRVPFAHGALLPVLGRALTIRHDPSAPRGVFEEGDAVRVGGPADDVARRLRAWLTAQARAAIARAIEAKSAQVSRTPGRIALRDTRTRWGSCSSRGDLSFSWRLVLAPPEVLDYVVAHELAHLAVRGHGPEFWRVAGDLATDLPAGRGWLRQHGRELFRYG
jgi:predicted metal-dependent hydrolase